MIFAASRYARDVVVVDEAQRRAVLPKRRLVEVQSAGHEHVVVVPGNTLFSIAAASGLGPENWWAVALYNSIRDGGATLPVGTVLVIPNQATMQALLT